MPRRPSVVDPVFTEIAKAIYGDIDMQEVEHLAKAGPGSSDVHVDRPVGKQPNPKTERKLALTGLGASGVATFSSLHAVKATNDENKTRIRDITGEDPKPMFKRPKWMGPKKIKAIKAPASARAAKLLHIKPVVAATAIGGGMLALHGVDVVGDALNARAQVKALRAANADIPAKPIAKAFRLKPLNSMPRRIPSLRAKRPQFSPQPSNPGTKAGMYQSVHKSEIADVTWTGVIAKVDADKRQVFGWASVSAINGEEVVDLQGDVVPIDEIEKSAYEYVIKSRKGGDMHRRMSKFDQGGPLHTADMIESFVVTPEKLEKMGLPSDALPHGWWVGYHVNDDKQWEMVKSGERAGFSIHGKGTRTAISKKASRRTEGPRARLDPTYAPTHSADAGVRRVNRVRLKAHRFAPELDGLARAMTQRAGMAGVLVKVDGHPRLRDRAEQAMHPPAVKLHRVHSTAIASMGYQPQTKRLSYEMRSRPGQPYQYKTRASRGVDALTAPSLGHHYATRVRGKTKRAEHYTPADRVRLFIDPQEG